MICKCSSCGSALRYDPDSNQMICAYCGNHYDPETIRPHKYMEANLCTCTACGAELMINDLETATFCSFCGQPTIVYSGRITELQPDTIVPFQVTREEAVAAIRRSLKKKWFVPREIRHFDVERLRGIYMPYWAMEGDYEKRSMIRANHGSARVKRWWQHYRHGTCQFSTMLADASRRLADESSQRLEPYDMTKAVPFTPAYLSGFYADRWDVDQEEAASIVKQRVRHLYEEKELEKISGRDASVMEFRDDIQIRELEYTMLPIWFLTFRYRDQPYTFLVNGQTGKVVGGVPYVERTRKILWVLLSILMLLPGYKAAQVCLSLGDLEDTLVGLFGMVGVPLVIGESAFARLKKATELTGSTVLRDMVRDREGGQ